MKQYFIGATPYLKCEVRAEDTGTLTDPSAITCTIYDKNGTAMSTDQAMTKSATGIYYYKGYAIPTGAMTGIWMWIPKVTDTGSIVTRDSFGEFEVMDR